MTTFALPSDCTRLPSGRAQNHLRFVAGVFAHCGCSLAWSEDLRVLESGLAFEACLGSDRLVFDFADRSEVHPLDEPSRYAGRFKFHYHAQLAGEDGWRAFSPISFLDWDEYAQLSSTLRYRAESTLIANRQRPRLNAAVRRQRVQAALAGSYGHAVRTAFIDQREFWAEVEDILVSVCVPGYRNDILDRGQLQYMALGACTISPELRIELPGGRALVPGRHYIACAPDYGDLEPLIRWCDRNRARCREIGAEARALFESCLHPVALHAWVRDALARHH